MSLQFPDHDTVRAVLTLATQAPSVHNSQPWHWRVGPDSLHLYADPSRHLPKADPDRRDLLISCGATLHHCAVALAALGWQPRIRRFPDPADRNHLASIEVFRQRAGELDITLAAAIARRRTDRRNYSAWPVPYGDISLMGARAARAGVMLRQLDLLPEFTAIIAESVRRHADDTDYLSELSAWSGRYGSLAGVPARNTPAPDSHAALPARMFAGPSLAQSISPVDNAVLIALGTETDDDLARLRAGEATSLVLLSATAMGLATCPVTEPLEIAETREAVRADVFGTSGYPQMMLRMGWAAVNADPLPATPRRPLAEVVDFEGVCNVNSSN
ncbi:nitroreductase [Mycolicibacterium sp. BK556]|uniref:Acg family FMN-binding oxidoreductase n=1 Tax=Mycobacteriaceae TaxID=1762 RepID=UPI00105DA2B5|nr:MULTISPECIES: NAD(P)H nitroreductase [Mycobacteriaceae]MBB3602987.1 nitroreductase [Mycolicibacterium sp. BK556]MBB3633182.1 nitroreductase [Mycolicibacterium sp. BK607]MBB3750732.1 nitroreductase [Mycolicibacterium sp. BK634]TDO07156.1 nitroreductase [Mycobacterium sp. BK086]